MTTDPHALSKVYQKMLKEVWGKVLIHLSRQKQVRQKNLRLKKNI